MRRFIHSPPRNTLLYFLVQFTFTQLCSLSCTVLTFWTCHWIKWKGFSKKCLTSPAGGQADLDWPRLWAGWHSEVACCCKDWCIIKREVTPSTQSWLATEWTICKNGKEKNADFICIDSVCIVLTLCCYNFFKLKSGFFSHKDIWLTWGRNLNNSEATYEINIIFGKVALKEINVKHYDWFNSPLNIWP